VLDPLLGRDGTGEVLPDEVGRFLPVHGPASCR
jgi:hypothetical protein